METLPHPLHPATDMHHSGPTSLQRTYNDDVESRPLLPPLTSRFPLLLHPAHDSQGTRQVSCPPELHGYSLPHVGHARTTSEGHASSNRSASAISLPSSPMFQHTNSQVSHSEETISVRREHHDVPQNYRHSWAGSTNSQSLAKPLAYPPRSPVLPPPASLRGLNDYGPKFSPLPSTRQVEERSLRSPFTSSTSSNERQSLAFGPETSAHSRQQNLSMHPGAYKVDTTVRHQLPSVHKNWNPRTRSNQTLPSVPQSSYSMPHLHSHRYPSFPSSQSMSSLEPYRVEYERERRVADTPLYCPTLDLKGKTYQRENILAEFDKVVQNCDALSGFAAHFGDLNSTAQPLEQTAKSSTPLFDNTVSPPSDALMSEMANRAYEVLQVLMRIKGQTNEDRNAGKAVSNGPHAYPSSIMGTLSYAIPHPKNIMGNGTEEDDMDIIRNKRTSSVSNSPARSKYRKRSVRIPAL
ncbi:hypothetical protein BC938DRAFT_471140 [Jimgerdemannia flammicorona]|uniref:Uncharacterized protein n=1 Tax=Jimgerdemannia flammicorona TaxID=994334 RepID=A0A433Q8Q9_9FUNG|nr:hypothetical protein BC938DRAFT_471140 [Jimgerdemannia flammicorona]